MKNDIAYANADFIPGAAAFPERWAEEARAFRELEAAIGRARLNHAYGDHEREKMDIFHPAGPAKGLVVFVHGGYWLRFDRSYWSHFATGATAAGWAVAMPSYPLAPEVRISDITASIRRAIDVASGMVAGPIRLTGHSAGGHLVLRAVMEDGPIAALDRVEKVVPISAVADLRPLLETSMNASLQLDEVSAVSESPALGKAPDGIATTVWVGGAERPVFLDQSNWLAEAWQAELVVVPDRHHFDVIDGLLDAESDLVRTILG